MHDSADDSLKPSLPIGATAKAVKLVTFTKDQGSTGMSGFWFLLASGYNISCRWDWLHRLKDDIFNACKRVSEGRGDIFKSILECALVMNMNYNPFGSGEWHGLKQEALASYILEHTADSPCFLESCDLIAAQIRAYSRLSGGARSCFCSAGQHGVVSTQRSLPEVEAIHECERMLGLLQKRNVGKQVGVELASAHERY